MKIVSVYQCDAEVGSDASFVGFFCFVLLGCRCWAFCMLLLKSPPHT